MHILADSLVHLPFRLDFCAKGPDVVPITCDIDRYHTILYFPPSMSDGTDGQGIFSEWAWWTGTILRVTIEFDVAEDFEVEVARRAAIQTGDEVLRRFLNAYRLKFDRPDVHPVKIDVRKLTLTGIHPDGRHETLPEPFDSFFYRTMPTEPPLGLSLNETNRKEIEAAVCNPISDAAMPEHLRLDAQRLRAHGEHARADLVETLVQL